MKLHEGSHWNIPALPDGALGNANVVATLLLDPTPRMLLDGNVAAPPLEGIPIELETDDHAVDEVGKPPAILDMSEPSAVVA